MAVQVDVRRQKHVAPPAHHVYESTEGDGHTRHARFRNPWSSWHVPSTLELLQGLEWGVLPGAEDAPPRPTASSRIFDMLSGANRRLFGGMDHSAPSEKACGPPLSVQTPEFASAPHAPTVRATWLGHASVLVKLPALENAGVRPLNVLFDPIFSQRCSPSQSFGPLRSFPPPCTVQELPGVDLVIISHNHYDHLDLNTVEALWRHHSHTVHFVVPLGNKAWFLDLPCGISGDRVHELDWWDEILVNRPSGDSSLRIVCTPAQHGSGRSGRDANATLWASWMLEYKLQQQPEPFRAYFGGDSGYQFRLGDGDQGPSAPACPAFGEIATKVGTPDFLMLPVSVGATYAYLKSFDPLPDWLSPVPRLSDGLTGANHMSASDAVHVFQEMTSGRNRRNPPVAMGIHWGTFVEGPAEVAHTAYKLKHACQERNVRFMREVHGSLEGPSFALVNHGQSVELPL
mgnify:FL=1